MRLKITFIGLSLIVALVAIYFDQLCNLLDYDEDIDRNTMQLIESRGFKGEDHYVVTEDGYILLVTRIVNPYVTDRKKLRPILLRHGWMSTPNQYLTNSMGRLNEHGQYEEDNDSGPVKNTLAFVLAINEFDVWLAHTRGSPDCINHTKLDSQDPEFWRFSLDETVEYDLPAMIAYIQKETQKEQLAYIGYSQGSMEMFMLLSSRPQYSQIVKPFIAIAPIFFYKHSYEENISLQYLQYLYKYLRSTEGPIMTHTKLHKNLVKLCQSFTFCLKFFSKFFGFQDNHVNLTRFGVGLSYYPASCSSWNFAHILQIARHGKVVKYDYGDPDKNMLKYNSTIPPDYDFNAVNSTNIALIYMGSDVWNHIKDVDMLKKNLKVPLLDDYLVPDLSWIHIEAVLGVDAGKYVNTRILDILSRTL